MPSQQQIAHETNNFSQPSKVIRISSKDSQLVNQNKNQLSILLEDPLQKDPYNEVMVFSIHNISLPFCFYNIRDDYTNKLFYSPNIPSVGLSEVSIYNGFYNFYDKSDSSNPYSVIDTDFKTQLEITFSPCVFTIDQYTRQITIYNPSANTISFLWRSIPSITLTDRQTTIYTRTANMLGFDTADTGLDINAGVSVILKYLPDELYNIHQLKIKTDIPTGHYIDKGTNTKTFSTINIGETIWGKIIKANNQPYLSHNLHSQTCDAPVLNSITIELTDEEDTPIDMLGIDWTIDIKIDFRRKVPFIRVGTPFNKKGQIGNTDIYTLQRLAYYNRRNINQASGVINGGWRPVVPRGLPIKKIEQLKDKKDSVNNI